MRKLLSAVLLGGASLMMAAPAQSAVFVIAGSPFTIPPAAFSIFGNGFTSTTSFTDYFTFTLNAVNGADASSGLQAVKLDGTGVNFTTVELFSGTVSGTTTQAGGTVAPGASLIDTFSVTNGTIQSMASLNDVPLSTGNYFIKVAGNVTASTRDAASYSGTLDLAVSAVPEPATWGLMLLGFGLVGSSLRSRRRGVVAA